MFNNDVRSMFEDNDVNLLDTNVHDKSKKQFSENNGNRCFVCNTYVLVFEIYLKMYSKSNLSLT